MLYNEAISKVYSLILFNIYSQMAGQVILEQIFTKSFLFANLSFNFNYNLVIAEISFTLQFSTHPPQK